MATGTPGRWHGGLSGYKATGAAVPPPSWLDSGRDLQLRESPTRLYGSTTVMPKHPLDRSPASSWNPQRPSKGAAGLSGWPPPVSAARPSSGGSISPRRNNTTSTTAKQFLASPQQRTAPSNNELQRLRDAVAAAEARVAKFERLTPQQQQQQQQQPPMPSQVVEQPPPPPQPQQLAPSMQRISAPTMSPGPHESDVLAEVRAVGRDVRRVAEKEDAVATAVEELKSALKHLDGRAGGGSVHEGVTPVLRKLDDLALALGEQRRSIDMLAASRGSNSGSDAQLQRTAAQLAEREDILRAREIALERREAEAQVAGDVRAELQRTMAQLQEQATPRELEAALVEQLQTANDTTRRLEAREAQLSTQLEAACSMLQKLRDREEELQQRDTRRPSEEDDRRRADLDNRSAACDQREQTLNQREEALNQREREVARQELELERAGGKPQNMEEKQMLHEREQMLHERERRFEERERERESRSPPPVNIDKYHEGIIPNSEYHNIRSGVEALSSPETEHGKVLADFGPMQDEADGEEGTDTIPECPESSITGDADPEEIFHQLLAQGFSPQQAMSMMTGEGMYDAQMM